MAGGIGRVGRVRATRAADEALEFEYLDLARLGGLVEDDVVFDPGVEALFRDGDGVLLSLLGHDGLVVFGVFVDLAVDVLPLRPAHHHGHRRMSRPDPDPSRGQGQEPPRQEVRGDGHDGARTRQQNKDGAGQRLVAEVRLGHDQLDDLVVHDAEVLHDVLQVAHVSEEIPGQLLGGFYRPRWRKGRAPGGVSQIPDAVRVVQAGTGQTGRRMPCQEGRNEYPEQGDGEGNDAEEVGVQADKGVDGEEGEGVAGLAPGEEAEEAGLKFENDTDARVEAPEVVGHGADGKARAVGEDGGRGGAFEVGGGIAGAIVGGDYLGDELLEEFVL